MASTLPRSTHLSSGHPNWMENMRLIERAREGDKTLRGEKRREREGLRERDLSMRETMKYLYLCLQP